MSFTLLSATPLSHEDSGTPAQHDLYNFLLDRLNAESPPSMVEMMQAMDCKSPAPIEVRLRNLELNGFIESHSSEQKQVA